MSFTKAPDANLDAQILARMPPVLGGSAAGAGGVFPCSAKPTTRSPPLGGSAAGAGGMLSLSAKPPDGLPLAFCTTC